MSKSLNVRAIAANILHGVIENSESLSNLNLPESLSAQDKALAQELIYGSCRWFYFLEDIHQKLLNKPLHKKDKIVYSLLKVGIYQILYTRIPKHAAINETVDATKQLGKTPCAGLVNAVLRRVSSELIKDERETAKLSHPEWIQQKVSHNWPEQAADIFYQNNLRPPMTLRVNAQNVNRSKYMEMLEAAEISAKESDIAPYGIVLDKPCNVSALPNFAEGYVSVQDEAAQLCCDLLDLHPNQRVLDACAAPGGKTCAMLERESSLAMTALDADGSRATRIEENLSRLSLQAKISVCPAEQLENWWDNQLFDRILLDAPCSATGVIRRHPDIKLLRQEGDIVKLATLQLEILKSLWPTLASGGKLLYATCSIFPQENNRVIERFLKQETSAKLEKMNVNWGFDTGFGRQLFPTENSHDGFFYALLSKC